MLVTRRDFMVLAACAAAGVSLRAKETEKGSGRIVYEGPDGRLVYVPDDRGNIVPDFSRAGYGGGGVAIPNVSIAAEVRPGAGDATERIQVAIDRVSALPPGADGVRGAVLLCKGRYPVGKSLIIAASGVVLRGESNGEDGAVLVGAGRGQRTLISLCGQQNFKLDTARQVLDAYVPVGARRLRLSSTKGLAVGDTVFVRREGNAAWIREIAMDRIMGRPNNPASTQQWKPFAMDFDRVITAIDGDIIEIDAPVMCAIEAKWGGGSVIRYQDQGRISQVGVENLRGESEFDRSVVEDYQGVVSAADEDHAWSLVGVDHAVNAWVRRVSAVHFGYACVNLQKGASGVTVEECTCTDMVSKITGGRRYPFVIEGQRCLFQRCTADTARHSFVVQARACGPNVFLDCVAGRQFATSEPHHRWSVGGLFDNVHADIAIQDRQYMGSGHGWSGANYVAWNCEGSLVCQKPPTAQNYAFGHVGRLERGAFERPRGYLESEGKHVSPRSLYTKQLQDRQQERSRSKTPPGSPRVVR